MVAIHGTATGLQHKFGRCKVGKALPKIDGPFFSRDLTPHCKYSGAKILNSPRFGRTLWGFGLARGVRPFLVRYNTRQEARGVFLFLFQKETKAARGGLK